MALEPGTNLGGFEIVGLLGVGGFGEVYRARDTKLGREVAIKVLPDEKEFIAETRRARRDFYRQSRAARDKVATFFLARRARSKDGSAGASPSHRRHVYWVDLRLPRHESHAARDSFLAMTAGMAMVVSDGI